MITYRCQYGYHQGTSQGQQTGCPGGRADNPCTCPCHSSDAPTYAPAPTPDKTT